MSSTQPQPKRDFYPQLTSVRFLAAFIVVLFHFDDLHKGLGPYIGGILRHGYIGVSFFFVLSGFIISANYFDRFRDGKTSVKDFLWARFSRIYPLYIISIVIMLPRLFLQPNDPMMIWAKENPLRTGLSHLFAVQSIDLKVIEFFNAPAWSISTEIFFYFCFPLAIPFLAKLRTRGLAATAAFLFALSAILPYLYHSNFFPVFAGQNGLDYGYAVDNWLSNMVRMNFLARVPEFLIGVICYRLFLAYRRPKVPDFQHRTRDLTVGIWLISGVAFFVGMIARQDVKQVSLYFGQFLGTPFFATSLLLLVICDNWFTRWLRNPTWILLGEASYAMYIFHIPVKHFCITIMEKVLHIAVDRANWLHMGPIILAAVAVSIPIFKFVETPIRKALIGWSKARQARKLSSEAARVL